MQYVVKKVTSRYANPCRICFKQHKRGYVVDAIFMIRTDYTNYDFTYNFVCSKKCADMYILARI